MYHRTKKVMFIDATSGTYINFDSKNKDKDPNLYLVIAWEYENIWIFLRKTALQFGQKRFSLSNRR